MSAEELVAEIEAAEDAARLALAEAERHKTAALLAEARLIALLGDGEAVIAPSGRVFAKVEGPSGAAKVNEAAIDEHAERLPESCRPRQVTRYPGVTAIREAAKAHQLPAGVALEDLLVMATATSKIVRRSLPGVRSAA